MKKLILLLLIFSCEPLMLPTPYYVEILEGTSINGISGINSNQNFYNSLEAKGYIIDSYLTPLRFDFRVYEVRLGQTYSTRNYTPSDLCRYPIILFYEYKPFQANSCTIKTFSNNCLIITEDGVISQNGILELFQKAWLKSPQGFTTDFSFKFTYQQFNHYLILFNFSNIIARYKGPLGDYLYLLRKECFNETNPWVSYRVE